MKRILIIWMLAYLVVPAVAQEGQGIVVSPFPVTLDLQQAEPDNRGTDVRQVKDITVDFDGEEYETTDRYNILVYVDGMAAWEYRDKALPFTFQWNFRGLTDGTHQIKIEVEDKESLAVLAVQEEAVEVVRPERPKNWEDPG